MSEADAPPETVQESGPPPIDLLPWHAQAAERLGVAVATARLPHGLLLQGPAGVGKEQFASALAATLLCRDRDARFAPCGHCAECQLSAAGNHPDVHWVRPEEDRKTVGVDQVRVTCERLAMTSLRSGYRVAILTPADKLTAQAQNALLKTLEEPAPRTVLVLVTSRPSALLPTLRSRCQRIEIARPDTVLAMRWLGERLGREPSPRLLGVAGGAPLRALGLAPHFEGLEQQMTALLDALFGERVDVTRAAADMLGDGLPARLDWLEAWLAACVRRAGGLADETALTFRAGSPLQRATSGLNITAAFQVLDRLREARRLLEGSASPALVVETVLLDLRAAARPR